MTYFNFNLLSTRRYVAPGAPNDDTSALVMSLDDEPQIDVVAVLERCGTPAILMIGSETLTESEVEALLDEKFKETGREVTDYIQFPAEVIS
jgi:hypothetical protein